MFVVVFESVVMVVLVVVLVVSVVVLLSELSLQAATVAEMANTAKNFFMLVGVALSNVARKTKGRRSFHKKIITCAHILCVSSE